MSLIEIVPMRNPFCRGDFFDFPTPSRLFDQHFGQGLGVDDLLPSSLLLHNCCSRRPRRQLAQPQNSGVSQIQSDANKFQVILDVNQFTPEEISVKTLDNAVVICGKHEEKVDEHGYVSRQFQRRYILPESVKANTVSCSLSSDGILTIEAPKKQIEALKPNERIVPIERKEAATVTQEETNQQTN